MKKVFKTMAFTLLGLVLSVNLMAATSASIELCTSWNKTLAYATAYTQDYTIDNLNGGTMTMTLGVQGVYRQSNANTYFQMNKKTGYFKNTTKLPGKITKIETTWSVNKPATKCYFATNAAASSSDATVTVTAATSVTYTPDDEADYYYFNIDVSTGSGSAQMTSCKVYYEVAGTPSGKDVTITADDELELTAEESDGTITVTYGDDVADKDITLYADAECKTAFTGDWFTAELNSTSGNIDYIAKANTGAAREAYIQIYVIADDAETDNTKVIKVTQAKYSAPTGTFEKFTGATLKEGDYVICVGTDAMKNSVTSNRLDYASVTVSSDKITNPEASVIWHIAPAAEGNWSIFNTAYDSNKGGYAAGTGTKNQAGILAATTDVSTETKAQWTCAKVTNGYNFENVANSAAGVNSKLQKNGTYGFACYGSFSDITLYKKHVDLAKSAVTFATCTNGSVGAQVKGAAITSGAIVDEDEVVTLTNTPATGYKLDAYKVYKTGDESTTVTVKEDGTFTMPAYAVTVSATFSLSIETPVLSEAAGDKNDAINVKVSNYNGDYSYYYTLDGTNPTNASTLYVDADGIAINASCTLKVIAYKDAVTSSVASAAYNLPLMTMDAIFAKATAVGSTATAVRVKFTNCVVTGVSGDNVYLTDNAGKGLIIYQSSHGFAVNDKLNGVVNVQLLLYKGSSEIKGLTSSTDGLTVTKDGSVSPITTMSIASLSGVNTGAVLSYTNLIYDNGYFSDGENTIQPYNTFKIADYPDFADGDKYNVTGVYIQYNTTKEIAPRSLADLEKIEATKYAINIDPSIENGSISTDPETEAADGIKVTLSATPDAGYMLGEWIVTDADDAAVTVTNNQFTMPAKAVTVSATFVELPIWATTYTSNVTVGTDKVKLAEAYQPAGYPEDGYDAKKDGTNSKAAAISIKVPANTTELHYHLFAWNGEGGKTVTIKKGEETLKTFENVADAGLSNNSPYTLQNNPIDAYGYVALEGITEETTITFSTAAVKNRICLFGVNAIQPAAITIAPAEKNFGEVKQGFDAEQVFSLTPNAFATGTITAEIDGEGFSASAVTENKVTVTFAPTEIKDYNATLIIKHDGTQMCTATLTGKGITATNPEIVVSDDEIDFGKVKQDATVADQTVTVTLNYLDAATASIDDDTYFSIDKTELVAGENTITISATASSMGEKSATITITGEGATTKTIDVKMDVTSKWAGEYTSNVKVGSDKVVIGEEEYEAVKAGSGSSQGSTTITVPEGAYALHFHAAGWNNEDVTLAVKNGDTELGSFSLYKDAGVKGSGPSYTLAGENYDTDQYFHVEFDALEAETDFTFEATSGNRFVLYGVNQEGGVLPVLDHITIGGEATKLNYNTTDAFDPVGLTVSAVYTLKGVEQAPVDVTDKVDWTFDPATFNTVGEGLSVTATASFTDGETKTADKVITGISVEEATPSISASKVNIEFGEVIQGATVEPIQSKITLKYIDEVSVTLSETTAFEIDKTSMTETGYLTISAVTTAEVGEYTATVTIKDLASETNKVLNLSITIKEAPQAVTYTLVTDVKQLAAGDIVVFGSTYTGGTDASKKGSFVNGVLGDNKYLASVSATIDEEKLTATGACEFTLAGGEGSWMLTSSEGQLGATAVKANLTTKTTAENYVGTWTIAIDETTYNATIKSTNENYGSMSYNGSSPRFANYSSVQNAIQLYKKEQTSEVVRTGLTSGKYGTICLNKEVTDFEGAEFYSIVGYQGDQSNPTGIVIESVEDNLVAGMPYIFKATASQITVTYTGEQAVTAPVTDDDKTAANGLIGSFVETKLNAGYYGIQNNALVMVVDADVWVDANRAYIDMEYMSSAADAPAPAPGVRRVAMSNSSYSAPTDLNTLNSNVKVQKVMKDGQLYIIRDTKMYNAQGQLVK